MQLAGVINKPVLLTGSILFIALWLPVSAYSAPPGYSAGPRGSGYKGQAGMQRNMNPGNVNRGNVRSANDHQSRRSFGLPVSRQSNSVRTETSVRTESPPRSVNSARSYNVANDTRRSASNNPKYISRPVSRQSQPAPSQVNRTSAQVQRNNTFTSKRQQLTNNYAFRSTSGRSRTEAVQRLRSVPVNFNNTNNSSKYNFVAKNSPSKSGNIFSSNTTTVANKTISIRGNTSNVGIRGNTATHGLRDNPPAFDNKKKSVVKITAPKSKNKNYAKNKKSGHGNYKDYHGYYKHHKHHNYYSHYYYSPFVFFSYHSYYYPYRYYPGYFYSYYPYAYSYYPFYEPIGYGPIGYDEPYFYDYAEPVYSASSPVSNTPFGLNSTGWSYLAEGNYQAAMIVFNDEVQMFPDAGLPKVGFSLVTAALGNIDDAASAMREAFEVDPDSIRYISNENKILDLINNLIETYEYEIQPGYTHPDEKFMLAALHYIKHDYGSAHEAINLAILDGDKSQSLGQLHNLVDNELSSGLAADYY